MRQSTLVRIFFFFLMMAFASMSNQAWAQKKKTLSEEEKRSFDNYYLNGAKEKLAQNYDEAIKQFKLSMAIDPTNSAVYYNLADLYVSRKFYQDAKQYALKAVELDNDNLWYKKLLCDTYELTGELENAAKVTYEISKKENAITNLIQAAFYYEQAKNLSEAIKMLNIAEKKAGVNEDIAIRKEQLFLAQNQLSKAIKEIKKLGEAFPNVMRYQVMLAELYLVNGKTKEGVNLYQKILVKDPGNGYAAFALGDYYHIEGDNEKWFYYMKKGMASTDVDIKSKLRMMIQFMTSKAFPDTYDKSQELADIFIATHPTEPSALLVKGDLYIEQAKPLDARIQYLKAIDIDPAILVAWEQLIFCDSRIPDFELMKKDCDLAIENFPNQMRFYIEYTIACLQVKKYEEATVGALKGIANAGEDTESLGQLYVSLGDAYHYLNKHKECDSAYENALKVDSNNSYALNNYAYFLSLRKLNLDKAESMSKKSLIIEPRNPSYYDTYGWIRFQQKQYEDAKINIEKSLEMEPNNTEVMDHLGDVYFQLNQKEKAIEIWKQAREKGRVNELLNKKIKDGKWYE